MCSYNDIAQWDVCRNVQFSVLTSKIDFKSQIFELFSQLSFSSLLYLTAELFWISFLKFHFSFFLASSSSALNSAAITTSSASNLSAASNVSGSKGISNLAVKPEMGQQQFPFKLSEGNYWWNQWKIDWNFLVLVFYYA